jgi:hypothetical protein
MRKSYRDVSRGVRGGSGATSELTTEAIGAGRELLNEFRAEVADILDQARSELGEMASQRVKQARKGARRTRRRIGL